MEQKYYKLRFIFLYRIIFLNIDNKIVRGEGDLEQEVGNARCNNREGTNKLSSTWSSSSSSNSSGRSWSWSSGGCSCAVAAVLSVVIGIYYISCQLVNCTIESMKIYNN